MNSGTTIWTDEKIALLRRLYDEGKSATESAVIMGGGITRNAVVGKWHRLNFSGRAKPELGRKGPRPAGVRKSPSLAVVPSTREPVESAPPLVVPTTAPDDGREPCNLIDLASDRCKWGVDFQDGQHLFCNRPQQVGKPYCPEHVLASISKAVGAFDDGENDLIRKHWDQGHGLHRLVRMLGRQKHAITRQAQYILKLGRAA
ncbi:MAG: GcrA family cell cycle regulator [Pseudomonadota bacterium]